MEKRPRENTRQMKNVDNCVGSVSLITWKRFGSGIYFVFHYDCISNIQCVHTLRDSYVDVVCACDVYIFVQFYYSMHLHLKLPLV
jgi:hypothetical protein